MPYNMESSGPSHSSYSTPQRSPYRFPCNSIAKQPSLYRNYSVTEPSHSGKKGFRRTKSFTMSENSTPTGIAHHHSSNSQPSRLRFYVDDAIHELFSRKDKSGRSKGRPFSILSSLFTCWNPRKSAGTRSENKRVAELLEVSRRQQSELQDKQDTIDTLEWQLEQMQALTFMEREVAETAGRSTPSAKELAASADELVLQQCMTKDMEEKENQQPQTSGNVPHNTSPHKTTPSAGSGEIFESPEAIRNSATLLLFEMAIMRARFSIRSFCKALIKRMEASGFSVLKTLSELEPNVVLTRKEHVVYILESRINKAFFHCFENDSFDDSGLMRILDPHARCAARLQDFQRMKLIEVDDAVNSAHPSFDAEFRQFCERKTCELWSQFSWRIAFSSREERDVFTAAFLDAAKSVWLLHKLAFSLNPHVPILRVGKGLEIDPIHVEAVPNVGLETACKTCAQFKVEFQIMPGFRAMDKVIKCQVYQHVQCMDGGGEDANGGVV